MTISLEKSFILIFVNIALKFDALFQTFAIDDTFPFLRNTFRNSGKASNTYVIKEIYDLKFKVQIITTTFIATKKKH